MAGKIENFRDFCRNFRFFRRFTPQVYPIMKNPWILSFAALIVGAVGGFISGKSGDSPDTKTSIEETAMRTRSASRTGLGDDAAKRASRARTSEEARLTTGYSARVQAMMDFYAGLTPEQLAEEAKKLDALPMSERMMASFMLFGRWAEVDPTAAMAFSNTMGMAGGFVRPTILQSWASVDPENAARYYAENPREFAMMGGMGGRGQNGASIIAGEWARQDPEAALAWASSLGGEKGQAMTAVVSEVAQTDPAKAAQLAMTMDPADQKAAFESIALQWGAKNFAEAQNWVNSLPADQRQAALASAIEGLSRQDAVQASQEVEKMAAGEARDNATAITAANWAKTDAAAAAEWLMKEGSEEAQRSSMDDLISNWVNTDSSQALEFIQNLPEGTVKDRGISEFALNDRQTPTATLVKMVEEISDQRDQTRATAMLTGRWMQEDPEAAKEYIQQSTTIPDGMKERLLSGRGFGGPPGRPNR